MPSNADIIQNGLEAVAESDVEGLVATLHEEVEWRPPEQGTLAEAFVGHDGVTKLFGQLFESWERIGHVPTKLMEGDDVAIVIADVHLRARMSGLEINEEWAYFVEFRDGLIWKVQMYTDPREALTKHSDAVAAAAPDFPE